MHGQAVLQEWGLDNSDFDSLRAFKKERNHASHLRLDAVLLRGSLTELWKSKTLNEARHTALSKCINAYARILEV